MRVRLEVTRGPAAGRVFTFDEPDVFIFGRGADAHCSIPSDGTISRNHFMIQLNPPDCTLLDLDSSNGTVVNSTLYGGKKERAPGGGAWKKPVPVRLRDGDRIVAGKSYFRVGITYELECQRCGVKFIAHGDAELARMGGVPVCEECAPGEKADETEALRVKCVNCGRDVTDEAGVRAVGGRVSYICRRCRSSTVRSADVRGAARQERPAERVAAGAGGKRLDLKDAPPPPEIEGFEYLRLLGMGGMGAVYLARETASGDLVALKTMLPDVAVNEEAASLFEREAQLAGAIDHPNVVKVHRFGHAGPMFYCLMEYVEGTDVGSLVTERGGRVPETEAAEITLQALAGLACAHEQGIVHRDIKPENVLLHGEAPPWIAKVTDFGLAKSFEHAGLSGLTMEGAICGSLWFMPREQIIRYKWVRPTTDVYAMGATFYYMLTGKPVKRGLEDPGLDTPAAVRVITSEPVVPIRDRDPSVRACLADIIDTSLSEEESKRYRNAGEMRAEMLRAMGG